jgi:hypothetical protein
MPLEKDLQEKMKFYEVETKWGKLNTRDTFIIPMYVPTRVKDFEDIFGKKYTDETLAIKVAVMKEDSVIKFTNGRLMPLMPQDAPKIDYSYVTLEDYRKDTNIRDILITSLMRFLIAYDNAVLLRSTARLREVPPEDVLNGVNTWISGMIYSLSDENVKKLNEIFAKRKLGENVNLNEISNMFASDISYNQLLGVVLFLSLLSGALIPEVSNIIKILYVYIADMLGFIPIEVFSNNVEELVQKGIMITMDFTVAIQEVNNAPANTGGPENVTKEGA